MSHCSRSVSHVPKTRNDPIITIQLFLFLSVKQNRVSDVTEDTTRIISDQPFTSLSAFSLFLLVKIETHQKHTFLYTIVQFFFFFFLNRTFAFFNRFHKGTSHMFYVYTVVRYKVYKSIYTFGNLVTLFVAVFLYIFFCFIVSYYYPKIKTSPQPESKIKDEAWRTSPLNLITTTLNRTQIVFLLSFLFFCTELA